MKFTKMQGCGNDYIYFNCFEEKIEDPEQLSIRLSDRHTGIGGDGIVLIKPSDKADFFMDMYNNDGSRGRMCGNAIRCVGKYVYEHGMTDKKQLDIETLSGIKHLQLIPADGSANKTEADSPNADKEKTTQTIRPKNPMKMESFDHARITPNNENSEGQRPEDTISDSSTVHYHEDKRDLVKEYREKLSDFTWEELAIILAKMVKMSASKETQDFVNWGDEKIASHWNNVLKKKCMDPRYSDLLNYNIKLTLFLIKERLKAEKGSEQFLTAYEEKLKNKLATKRMENK